MICLTFDTDWAPEEVIEDTVSILEQYGVKATFFATHDSNALKKANKELFEIAIHPNFNLILNGNGKHYKEPIEALMNYYPDSKGTRSHSLVHGSYMLLYFKDIGLVYDSNLFLPYQKILPFTLPNGLVRIPYNWEDDYHFALGYSFDNLGIDLNLSGIKIFNFHPIHIYLNSENNDRYLKIREYQQDAKRVLKQRNSSQVKGVRDALIYLLEYIKNNNISTYCLKNEYNNLLKERQATPL